MSLISVIGACAEPCQTPQAECFAKTINREKPLTILAKRSILDVLYGFEYVLSRLLLVMPISKQSPKWYLL